MQSPSDEEDSLVRRPDNTPINLGDPRKEPVAQTLGICYICVFMIASMPCIVGLVIAAEYTSNIGSIICKRYGAEYLIKLDVWLYISCGLGVLASLLYMLLNCYQAFGSSLIVYTQISQILVSQHHALFQIVITLFHTIWAVIGIYIYTNQMSVQCKSSPIGNMILIFCIFELLLTCCVSCCAACMLSNSDRSITALTSIGAGFMFTSPNQNNTNPRQESVSSSSKIF